MTTNALRRLEYGDKTAKRAQFEGFEFSIEEPGRVRVTNASYGDDADDHSYLVTVTEGVPVACDCPADEYHAGACKHRVAVAIRGPIMDAVTSESEPVRADGGAVSGVEPQGKSDEDTPAHASRCDNPECEGYDAPGRPPLSFECWDTRQEARR